MMDRAAAQQAHLVGAKEGKEGGPGESAPVQDNEEEENDGTSDKDLRKFNAPGILSIVDLLHCDHARRCTQ